MSPSTSIESQRLRVADVVDRHVVVLAPEEGHGVESVTLAQDVSRRRLALTLRHDPVLDPDALAGVRIRPARDVAGGKDAGSAGLEPLVHQDPAVDREAGLLRQLDVGPDADAGHHEVGREPLAVRPA